MVRSAGGGDRFELRSPCVRDLSDLWTRSLADVGSAVLAVHLSSKAPASRAIPFHVPLLFAVEGLVAKLRLGVTDIAVRTCAW